jgi:hypothetical protein
MRIMMLTDNTNSSNQANPLQSVINSAHIKWLLVNTLVIGCLILQINVGSFIVSFFLLGGILLVYLIAIFVDMQNVNDYNIPICWKTLLESSPTLSEDFSQNIYVTNQTKYGRRLFFIIGFITLQLILIKMKLDNTLKTAWLYLLIPNYISFAISIMLVGISIISLIVLLKYLISNVVCAKRKEDSRNLRRESFESSSDFFIGHIDVHVNPDESRKETFMTF